jgi:hypothetical protein
MGHGGKRRYPGEECGEMEDGGYILAQAQSGTTKILRRDK